MAVHYQPCDVCALPDEQFPPAPSRCGIAVCVDEGVRIDARHDGDGKGKNVASPGDVRSGRRKRCVETQPRMKLRMSALISSGCVVAMPCGYPL